MNYERLMKKCPQLKSHEKVTVIEEYKIISKS